MRIKLSCKLTLEEIARAVRGRLSSENATVSYVVTDSRTAESGDLFIALKGGSFDGNDYIREASVKGAFTLGAANDATVKADSGECALLRLAHYYRRHKLKGLKHTVAITGSVGKTTTKEFLAQMLSVAARVHKTPQNMNNTVGLPLTVLSAPEDTEILILEMGMNHPGEIELLSKCAEPDLAIITNIGTAHIGNLGSRQAIARAKSEITAGLTGRLITPYDEPLLGGLTSYRFGINDLRADMSLSHTDTGVKITESSNESFVCDFFSSDERSLRCLAPAICAMRLLKYDKSTISVGVSSISDQNIRQKIISVNDITLICDFYNASPESFSAAIRVLAKMNAPSNRCVLIGDMLELGSYSDRAHRELGALAARLGIDKIFAFGKWANAVEKGAISSDFPTESFFKNGEISRPDITAKQVLRHCIAGDTVLLKASRGIGLERVVDAMITLAKE